MAKSKKGDLSKLDAMQPTWAAMAKDAIARAGPDIKAPEPPDLPDIATDVAARDEVSQVEIAELLEFVAEKARRQIEAINLYEPLPIQKDFHDCMCPIRLIRGSNRSGKTVSAAVEFARAVTGRDPHERYPAKDGRAYCVGKDQKHHGEVTYRKLFRAGAFKIIRDEHTRVFRAFRPWDDKDKAREKQAKPAPPLIPPRLIKSVSWDKKNEGIPSKVVLRNGWEINFLSSLGKPPQGMDVDVVWFDEEIVDSDWFPEMQTRLPDREGRFWWSATPQSGTDRLLELHLRCEAEEEERRRSGAEPTAKEFIVLLKDNPHIKDAAKRLMEQSLSDAERSVRVDGEFAIHGRKVYPEFRKAVHLIPYFDIPSHWTNYMIVDPGRQVCAGLIAAVPPPHEFKDLDFAVVLRDEIYVHNSDAEQFAAEAKRKTDGLQLERMVIDIHGARITEMGSGKTVIDQYQEALEEAGVACVRTGSQFEWGCDDVGAGVEAFRTWLKVGRQGQPKVFAIEDKTPNFVWEIERYRYKLKNGEVTDDPETRGKVHLMACARYLSMCDPVWVKPSAGANSASGAYAAFLAKLKKQKSSGGTVNLGPTRR